MIDSTYDFFDTLILAAVVGGFLWFLEANLTFYADLFNVVLVGVVGTVVSGIVALIIAVLFLPVVLTKAWDKWRKLWWVACTVYGEATTKTYKTFQATYGPVGGVMRVVIVKEDHGWYAFFCTDPNASVVEILEAFADRATIEQDFHDVKEVWGSGQQQVRNIWNNLAVYNLNL